MSARLTPITVAEREIARGEKRRARLEAELLETNAETQRWRQVLAALNGDQSSTDNAVEE